MKILFIEDTRTDIDAFDTALAVYNQENNGANIEAANIPSIAEFEALGNNLSEYDAVIVDIKLQNNAGETDADTEAGNRIVEAVESSLRNVPIYIYTGTPENISYRGDFVIKRYIKGGDTTYKDVIAHAYNLHCTGLMKIIGGKGRLQELIQRIYKENIIANLDKWIEHKIAGKNTEEILSRYIAACIAAHLESSCKAVKEEMFMIPPVGINLKTGSILKKNEVEEYFVVLTPECDLIVRQNGSPKTDSVLLCKLQSDTTGINTDNLRKILCYQLAHTYCLPKSPLADNITFLDFRKVAAEPYADVIENYIKSAQILPEFTKEITQKFSAYYSRQGQPDFENGELCEDHCLRPAQA